jgi:hypothetical protein
METSIFVTDLAQQFSLSVAACSGHPDMPDMVSGHLALSRCSKAVVLKRNFHDDSCVDSVLS